MQPRRYWLLFNNALADALSSFAMALSIVWSLPNDFAMMYQACLWQSRILVAFSIPTSLWPLMFGYELTMALRRQHSDAFKDWQVGARVSGREKQAERKSAMVHGFARRRSACAGLKFTSHSIQRSASVAWAHFRVFAFNLLSCILWRRWRFSAWRYLRLTRIRLATITLTKSRPPSLAVKDRASCARLRT